MQINNMYGISPIEEYEVGPMSSWVNDGAWGNDDNWGNYTWNSGDPNAPKKVFTINMDEVNKLRMEDVEAQLLKLMRDTSELNISLDEEEWEDREYEVWFPEDDWKDEEEN